MDGVREVVGLQELRTDYKEFQERRQLRDGLVLRLREKTTAAKLKLLVQDMKLFPVAIKLAYSCNYPLAQIMEIYRRYADHLYEKKRAYDESVQQYIHTIGYLDPSYVIARFLDPQRIHNLTVYLEALHRQGHATAALTTFLLNCYTKLKDTARLDRLVF
ncbi:vacuolar protein sorting-associated 11-like protein, partial [Nannochloropsis gaditana CCMP526]|uniref:vacuolar protein sorting-associated 11-like protein n=1 Tax=Nannochloropsis gaditana (strain CCMP526) TaxID=1093141 RepID=UPI00029F6AD6